jgi:hypothetical protein
MAVDANGHMIANDRSTFYLRRPGKPGGGELGDLYLCDENGKMLSGSPLSSRLRRRV